VTAIRSASRCEKADSLKPKLNGRMKLLGQSAHEVESVGPRLCEQRARNESASQQISTGIAAGGAARAWPNRYAGRVVELEQRKKEAGAALERREE
jgi:hypothetical protein